jgi:hypothetical protein
MINLAGDNIEESRNEEISSMSKSGENFIPTRDTIANFECHVIKRDLKYIVHNAVVRYTTALN